MSLPVNKLHFFTRKLGMGIQIRIGTRMSWSSLLLLLQFPPEVFLVDHSCGDFQQRRNRLQSCWRRLITNGGQSLHFLCRSCSSESSLHVAITMIGRPCKVSNALKKEITTSWQRKDRTERRISLVLGRVMIDLVSVLLLHSQQESINKTSLPYGSSWHVQIS